MVLLLLRPPPESAQVIDGECGERPKPVPERRLMHYELGISGEAPGATDSRWIHWALGGSLIGGRLQRRVRLAESASRSRAVAPASEPTTPRGSLRRYHTRQ